MYIYLFVILPIFYSIIIYLLFIFLIIYWLATVGDHCRRPGRQQENSWTHLRGRIRVYSHMQDFISTLSRTHQLLRPILTYLPIFSQCYS